MAELLYTYRLPSGIEDISLKPAELAISLRDALQVEVQGHLEAVERRHMGEENMSQVLANIPGYTQLLSRWAAVKMAEVDVSMQEGGVVDVRLLGNHLSEFEGAGTGKWLGRCLAQVLGLPEDALEMESTSGEGRPEMVQERRPREEGSRGFLRRMAYFLMFVPVITSVVILFLVWSWISDLQEDYDDLKNTVTVHKEQIIDAVEEGVKRSADVMDLYEAAKGSELWGRMLGNEEAVQDSVQKDRSD